MFIVHGAWLRKYMRWILAVLLLVLIPGFIAMFTRTGSVREDRPLPKIDGKPVDPGEYQSAHTAVMAQHLISSGERLPRTRDFDSQVLQESMLRLLLLRQANRFGLRTTVPALVQYIRTQPVFLDERGQFDPERYRQFTIRLLHSQITEAQFEEMMRQQYLIQRLQELVESGARVTPLELRQAFNPLYEKVTIDYVAFHVADLKEPPAVSDADAQAWFEKNKDRYRTPRLVQVRYARFPIDPAAETVSDKDLEEYYRRNDERFTNTFVAAKESVRRELTEIRAKRVAANRATEFTVKLVPEENAAKPDFRQLATAAGAQLGETKLFDPAVGTPELPVGRELGPIAAVLSAAAPFSDPLESTNDLYVLEFLADQPRQIPPLADVKAKIVAELQKERAYEAVVGTGQQAARAVQQLVAGGATFAQACAQLDLKVQTAGPFNFAEDSPDVPAEESVKEAALALPVNGVSDFLRGPDGGLFFRIKDRQPTDDATFEKQKARFVRLLSQRNRQALWNSWLNSLWQQERVDLGAITPPAPEPEPPPEPEG